MNRKIMALLSVFVVLSQDISAQRGVRSRTAPKTNTPAVLDFEGDRIGGERTGPFQSFLQGSQGPSFQSLLYMRKDFLEFQRAEFRRPQRGRVYRERVIYKREAGDFPQ